MACIGLRERVQPGSTRNTSQREEDHRQHAKGFLSHHLEAAQAGQQPEG